MAYIPENHKQYPVLPYSREHGGEVFQYHSSVWPHLKDLIGENLIPYGFKSYDEYFSKINHIIQVRNNEPETIRILQELEEKIIEWNRKEEWSICRYLGEDTDDFVGLHYGGYYYWPTTKSEPVFGGVIDDEEFTAYLYPTDPDLWEIIIDPTGMAYRTINGK